MGYPRAVMSITGFQLFIRAHFIQHPLIARGIFAWNKGRHTAHGKCATAMTGTDQQARIGTQERFVHGHHLAIWQDFVGVIFQCFDIAKDVVPTTTVQTDNVVSQVIQDLIHLEHGRQSLDQGRRFDGATRQADMIFGEAEHLTPPRRFVI